MLSKQREEINIIDQKLLELLDLRMDIVTQVAHIKQAHGMAIFDSQREQAILDRLDQTIPETEKKPFILDTFQAIMDYSKHYQAKIIQKEDHSS